MLTENMLWAWNVDIFVRLDLRGWAPPATHYHFNHWVWSIEIKGELQKAFCQEQTTRLSDARLYSAMPG